MKIATYGTMHLGVAFGVAWALTGDVAVAGVIATVEPAVQTLAYAIHERAWQRRERALSAGDAAAVPQTALALRPAAS
jgi:uncharacterized membrane protein